MTATRVFKIITEGKDPIILNDPNSDLLVQTVIDMYTPQYPELSSAKHKLVVDEDGVMNYELTPKIGTLG